MRNRAARLILIGALVGAPLPAAAQAPPVAEASQNEAANAVLAAVLVYAAGLFRARQVTCVVSETSDPLQAERRLLPMRQAAEEASAALLAASGPGPAPSDPPSRWHTPVYPGPDSDGTSSVAPALASHLDTQLEVALHDSRPRLVDGIDPGMVPAPLRSELAVRDCHALRLTSPVFAGDVAFVESATACSSLCATGALYALMRQSGRWTVVAVDFTWVS
jgi:hypothetical protein